jgi:hypothetical protein
MMNRMMGMGREFLLRPGRKLLTRVDGTKPSTAGQRLEGLDNQRASRRRPGDPCSGCCLHEVTGGWNQGAHVNDHSTAVGPRLPTLRRRNRLLSSRCHCDLRHGDGGRAVRFPLVDITVR